MLGQKRVPLWPATTRSDPSGDVCATDTRAQSAEWRDSVRRPGVSLRVPAATESAAGTAVLPLLYQEVDIAEKTCIIAYFDVDSGRKLLFDEPDLLAPQRHMFPDEARKIFAREFLDTVQRRRITKLPVSFDLIIQIGNLKDREIALLKICSVMFRRLKTWDGPVFHKWM